MKFLIPITLLFAGLSPLLNSKEGLDTKDLLLEDSYLNCGSREGRFKSFEIGRSGNVKAKSGLFSNYKITRKGEFFFLNGEKYPETKENYSYKNILTLNEKTFEEESGKLKLKNTTKIASSEKIISINYFIIDINELTFNRAQENYIKGEVDKIIFDPKVKAFGKCTKKTIS